MEVLQLYVYFSVGAVTSAGLDLKQVIGHQRQDRCSRLQLVCLEVFIEGDSSIA